MLRALSILLVVLAHGAVTTDTRAETRTYDLPTSGSLILEVPADWKQKIRRDRQIEFIKITFTPGKKKDMQFLVTALVGPNVVELADDHDALQRLVQVGMSLAAASAVEGSVKIYRFQADHGVGYMFSATDTAPEKDGYKYLWQGALIIDSTAILSFTILSNHQNSPAVNDAHTILKSAAFETM